ncbi:hypothetical protein QT13_19550 [Pectobacterium brasiliense]|uniref:CGNR zinc finger domain-containing protein n=1 Tax=Pectobacterium TaxID=122277 RepID=UPI00057F6C80|nr:MULTISPECIES: ABATE domain-containing protein [Pectobacterium]KHS64220.1 hypothetical protein QT13_19550 [Pectobacterium brasiliense]KHS82848.1 hypothetical protein RC83_19780 [Pectobacterium brasiliense]QSD35817.1 CGNR zinc finger domain-containing protein [Pectobacterium brasiliense]UPY95991.1 CGNR zinc finger domain-containing protein [Pectobacterium sp. 21LCBS03]
MHTSTIVQPHFLANNLALDLINSAFGTGSEYHDCLTDDASVIAWLKAAKQLPENFTDTPAGLMNEALALRQAMVRTIEAVRSGKEYNPEQINHILDSGRPVRTLEWNSQQAGFNVVECRRDNSCASLLEPVAMAFAALISGPEVKYIRQCEAHDCTLFFLDTTKSHRRRWCSMALCGNRMKVAAFRSRKQETD